MKVKPITVQDIQKRATKLLKRESEAIDALYGNIPLMQQVRTISGSTQQITDTFHSLYLLGQLNEVKGDTKMCEAVQRVCRSFAIMIECGTAVDK